MKFVFGRKFDVKHYELIEKLHQGSTGIIGVTGPTGVSGTPGVMEPSVIPAPPIPADVANFFEHTDITVPLNVTTVNVGGFKFGRPYNSIKTLKLKWTTEMDQDIRAFHLVDAEAELTRLLSEQIAAELDREIINDIHNVMRIDNNNYVSPGVYVREIDQTIIHGESEFINLVNKEIDDDIIKIY